MTGPAAIYTRQSHGKERSIAEQEALCRAACDAERWTVAGVYKDTTSASRFARGEREDWPRLIADLEAGRFGVLVMWESSRGDRDPETWMGLLRRCRDHSVLVHVVSHERTYDVTIPRDWRTLADEGVDAAYESEKTSLRIRRDLKAAAMEGRPHGPVVYGYERVYDSKTKELKEQRPHPGQAPIVREICERLEGGVPVSTVAADLNRRGVPSPSGGKWGRTTIRRIATSPAYRGRRTSGAGEHDGIWPPLVSEEQWLAVRRRLTDPARKVTRPGKAKWLLSYIATCGHCGSPLAMHKQGAAYRCTGGLCTTIRRDWLDVYVSHAVIGWVQAHAVEAFLASEDAAVVAARGEARRLQAELDELAGDLGISARTLAIREQALLPRLRAAERRALDAGLPLGVRALARARDAVPQAWEGLPLAAKREVIAGLMTVQVKRAHRKGAGTVGEFQARVVIDWKAG